MRTVVKYAAVVGVVALGASAAAAEKPLALEWADHIRDPKALDGGAVFVRTLYCRDARWCELRVTWVSRSTVTGRCLLNVGANVFRTADGDLRVQRNGDRVEIEADAPASTTKLSLALASGGAIVKQASGVIVSKPMGDDAVTARELTAFVKGTAGLESTREFSEVELGCSTLSVVAVKRENRR